MTEPKNQAPPALVTPGLIRIQKSQTADTRTCDPSTVTKEQLLASSAQHISDVRKAMSLFASRLLLAAVNHDPDKVSPDGIAWFHSDFVTGFKEHGWWDNHRRINRHHLMRDDGVPEDVNLLDVLEFVADCVMAGMGRSGSVYPLELKPEVLKRAFDNTSKLLQAHVVVDMGDSAPEASK